MPKGKSIKLSPKHGVNPALLHCFFCGEEQGIALFGKLKNDMKAPDGVILDYEPCDKCKELFAQGILMVGVEETAPDDRPPISKQDGVPLYPTGRHAVVTEDFIQNTIRPKELAEAILKSRRTVIDNSLLKEIMDQNEKLNAENSPAQ